MTLRISETLELPNEAGTWTFAILAIKGAGKTYGACDLAEEMVKNNIPIVALDGLGIWWGLRVGVKGKQGLPIVVFGGQHQDLPIPLKFGKNTKIKIVDEDRLRLMVAAILEAGINAVLDTSEFSKSMQRRMVATFVLELNHLNAHYGVRHVFIEEADMWCPQRGMTGDVAVSAGAIDDLVRRGGNFNLGCTLITQRSAVLNKDVLTQANCLIVLRILHKLDKDAVKTWVESVAHPKDPKIMKWFDSLRELKNGEAYVWKPENPKIFKQIKFRKRETLHATREFFLSSAPKNVKMMDVSEFVGKFKNVFEPKVKEPPKTLQLQMPVEQLRKVAGDLPQIQFTNPFGSYRSNAPLPQTPSIQSQEEAPVITVPRTEATFINQPRSYTFNLPEPEPRTVLGRLLIVFMKYTDRAGNRKWTFSSILETLTNEGWPTGEDEVKTVLQYLLQTGHLSPIGAGNRGIDYKFVGRDRVVIQPQAVRVDVP